jgi:pimeloyl-ACP methyl ester carboxylesterase
MADDLHALLTAAGIEPPCILAAHSLGGVIARRFIARYPGTVCGLLLIDSSHEDQVRRLRETSWHQGSLYNVRLALRRQVRRA